MCIDHIPYGDCHVHINFFRTTFLEIAVYGSLRGRRYKWKGEFGRAREKGKERSFPFFLTHPNSPFPFPLLMPAKQATEYGCLLYDI